MSSAMQQMSGGYAGAAIRFPNIAEMLVYTIALCPEKLTQQICRLN